ncbi:hypothetical protein DIURU_001552 [Diutina rugosa]|uniref:Uncharacterized protein n=1 Tax=Diutina rugosa TaxID=5481 RepID=A0A642UT95_DIURU|nr:uncharacterized protein DIURU_001552 [Diutina rugosa]KAA8905124.1 hypothetical protein DIURU_001552 [Diutina rugosa]
MSTRMADEVVYLSDTDNEEQPVNPAPKRPRVAPDAAMMFGTPKYEIPIAEETREFADVSTTWSPEVVPDAQDRVKTPLPAPSDSIVVIESDDEPELPPPQPQDDDDIIFASDDEHITALPINDDGDSYNDQSSFLADSDGDIVLRDASPVNVHHVVSDVEESDDDIVEINSADVDPSKFKSISWAPEVDEGEVEDPDSSYRQDSSFRQDSSVTPQPAPNPQQEQIQREVANRIEGYQQNRSLLIQGVNQWHQTLANLRTFQQRMFERFRHLSQSYSQGNLEAKDEIQQVQAQLHYAKNEIKQKESLLESSRKRLFEVDQIIHNLRTSQRLPFAYSAAPAVALHHRPIVNSNVYDGGLGLKEDVDLQTLLDNIRSDEDSEEGLEVTPKEMNVSLLKHQRKGLTWMLRMEKARNQGGILADDMGLGKTIQAIALIARNKPDAKVACKTTLIIAPVSLLRQWSEEIKQKIRVEHSISVGIFHGNTRKSLSSFARFKRYDVILTSYSTLQNEFKRHYAAELSKAKEEGQASSWLPSRSDNLNGTRKYESPFFGSGKTFFRIILDEAQYIKNKNTIQSRAVASLKGSYRFCLSGTPMQNSIDELYPILRFLGIRPYCFEDKFRVDIALPLKSRNRQYDDYDRESSMKRLRALLAAILLRRTKTSTIDGKPILELPKKHLNRLDVQLEKEESEFYKRVESKIQMSARKLLGKAPVEGSNGILALLTRLRQACLHSYLIEIGEYRRQQSEEASRFIKQWQHNFTGLYDVTSSMEPRAVAIVSDQLISPKKPKGEDEDTMLPGFNNVKHDLSEAPLTQAGLKSDQFDVFLDSKEIKTDSIESTSAQAEQFPVKPELESDETELADVRCPNCNNWYTPGQDTVIVHRKCGHIFCIDCVQLLFEDSGESTYKCPTCTEQGTSGKMADVAVRDCIDFRIYDLVWNQQMPKEQFDMNCKLWWSKSKRVPIDTIIDTVIADHDGAFPTSAKMTQCINKVKEIFEKYPGEKIIIFSQFTTLFDLMRRKLDDNEIKYLRYDGSMSVDAKNDTVKRFYQDDQYKVMFLSLKAGNVGLTLTCASHIIMMDPFWNPYVEDQAMDRAHRIGQTREVHVHRLFVSGTVESRILELQDHKRELIGAAMSESGLQTVARASKREIGFLFGLNNLKE